MDSAELHTSENIFNRTLTLLSLMPEMKILRSLLLNPKAAKVPLSVTKITKTICGHYLGKITCTITARQVFDCELEVKGLWIHS